MSCFMHLDYYCTFIFHEIMRRWIVLLKSGKTERTVPMQWEIHFHFFATVFVNEIPDILFRLQLLDFFFFFHFENEYLWTRDILGSVGVAAQSNLQRRLLRPHLGSTERSAITTFPCLPVVNSQCLSLASDCDAGVHC